MVPEQRTILGIMVSEIYEGKASQPCPRPAISVRAVCVSLTWSSCAFTHFTDEKAQRPSRGSEHSTGCFYDLLAHDIWKGTWNLHFNMGGF